MRTQRQCPVLAERARNAGACDLRSLAIAGVANNPEATRNMQRL